ncbi:UNVERIFIED_CONTAM: hypothetical protein Sangu_3198600 [Sesamum angustifolium]|uniref:Uncharacterized protein n=1 Tax=Sesamum angustifolium TaxID=2727405 RepID=A0AAW2JMM5_9LAMI
MTQHSHCHTKWLKVAERTDSVQSIESEATQVQMQCEPRNDTHSALDRATTCSFLEDHEIRESPKNTKYPPVDRLSSGRLGKLPTQSASGD